MQDVHDAILLNKEANEIWIDACDGHFGGIKDAVEQQKQQVEAHLELKTATRGGVLLLILRRKFCGRKLLRLMKRVRLMECLLKKGIMPSPKLCSTCSHVDNIF